MTKKSMHYLLAEKLGEQLLRCGLRCAVAESCTGGSLAAAMTDIPGSSQWFDCGFITYSNQSKQQLLGVSPAVIASEGAVSEAVVRAMAEVVLTHSRADVSVSISGVAGPDGGSEEKPVGTVWMAWASNTQLTAVQRFLFSGDRLAIRTQAVQASLEGLMRFTYEKP